MVTLVLFLLGVISLLTMSPDVTAFYFSAPVNLAWFARIVSHMLSHANWNHLLGNFIFGFPYMLYAEWKLKDWKKFTWLFFMCGVVALGGQCVVNWLCGQTEGGLIGSSGAIFGVVAWSLWSVSHNFCAKWGSRVLALFHTLNQAVATYFVLAGALAFVAYGAHLAGIACGTVLAIAPSISRRVKSLTSKLRKLLH